ncbi:chromosome 1 orf- related, partial [Cystoisospora suis]
SSFLQKEEQEEGSPSSSFLSSLSDRETLFKQPLCIGDKTCYFLSTEWNSFPSLCCLCSCRCYEGKEGEEERQQRFSCREEGREISHHYPRARVESEDRDRGNASSSATSHRKTLKHADGKTGLQFDWIVASECIYRPSNFQTLLDLLRARLKRRTGKALIAAKRYYFGIGGGSLPFLKFVRDAEETRRHARDEKKKGKKDLMEVTASDSGRDEKPKERYGNKGAFLDRGREIDCQTEREEEMTEEKEADHLREGDLNEEEEEDDLEIEIVHTIQDKVSNVRDILLLRKKDHLSPRS